jgi:hypothetical protein
MTTETQTQSENSESKPAKHVSGEKVVGYSVLGCLICGVIGIYKAMVSEGIGSAFCLFAAIAAFGITCYIYFRRD